MLPQPPLLQNRLMPQWFNSANFLIKYDPNIPSPCRVHFTVITTDRLCFFLLVFTRKLQNDPLLSLVTLTSSSLRAVAVPHEKTFSPFHCFHSHIPTGCWTKNCIYKHYMSNTTYYTHVLCMHLSHELLSNKLSVLANIQWTVMPIHLSGSKT